MDSLLARVGGARVGVRVSHGDVIRDDDGPEGRAQDFPVRHHFALPPGPGVRRIAGRGDRERL